MRLSRIIPLTALALLLPVAFFTAAAIAAHQTYCGDTDFDDWCADIDWTYEDDEDADDWMPVRSDTWVPLSKRLPDQSDSVHPAGNYD
jgi:hypothetical protein